MASTLSQKLIFLVITYGFILILFGIQKTLLQCNEIYKMSYGALHNSFAFLESSKRKRDGGKELKKLDSSDGLQSAPVGDTTEGTGESTPGTFSLTWAIGTFSIHQDSGLGAHNT